MLHLAFGYFISYLPYALLAKALSSGIIPGVDRPVGGLVLLPAAALGQLVAMPIFLGVSGWWRFAREQRIGGRRMQLPGRDTVLAAMFMAVVIGTTTLDVRGYAWSVPASGVSTLLAGIAASYILMAGAGLAPPGNAQLIAVVFIVGAVVALSYPALRDNLRGVIRRRERVVLFVCGGNQSRSAVAECIARAAMATTRSGHLVTIGSAGVKVHTPGAPMTDAAHAVLQEAGVIPYRHRSRPLTADLCRGADAIYCMTVEHRAAVLALAPDVADRTHCLADSDIPEPSATSLDDHRRTAALIQQAMRMRLAEQFP